MLRRFFLAFLLSFAALAGLAARVHAQPAPAAPRLTRPPRLTQFVEAPYPESERASGRSASVVLRLGLSATGTVEQAAVVESAGPAFDDAALAAVRQFVFEPAEIDGRPAAIRIVYRYEFVLRVEAPTTAIFDGIVRNREGRTPLANVTITLDDGRSCVTDAEGRFHFDEVAPGESGVTLAGERLTPLRTRETFEAGQRLEATYDVFLESPGDEGGDDLEIVVQAPPLRRQAVSTEVDASQARRVPGTQGDVLRVVESLPGVARAAAGSGALVVWGAAPEDTRVYVDGVRVPRLYHDGGLRSVVHGDFVRAVSLVPGGYGAAYGRGLGGLVTVETEPLDAARGVHGSVAADALDLAGAVRGAVGPHLRFAAAARRSHLADLLALGDTDLGDYFPLPRYYDAQARVAWVDSTRESLELSTLLSGDTRDRVAPSPDPARVTRENRALAFQRLYLRWKKQLADGAALTVTPWLGFDQSALSSVQGATDTALRQDTTLYGLRASWRRRVADWLTLEVGLDAEVSRARLRRQGSTAAPAREGDVRVFGQPPPDTIAADTWTSTQVGVAPYVEGDVALFDDTLHLLPGLRVDPLVQQTSRRVPAEGNLPATGLFAEHFAAEPRLTVRWAPGPRFALTSAVGRYHQPASPPDLSAAFGTPTLPTAAATHVLAGTTVGLTEKLSIEATAFYARSDGLAVRSDAESPLRAEALVPSGDGRAYGAQVLVRHALTGGFFGWLSYSLLRSERRDGEGRPWRTFDFDQTHVLTALFSWEIGAGFEVGVRARYATGFPRTEVVSATYDARRDVWQPTFGAINETRIPAFFQLDARVAKRFRLGPTSLDVFLEVQNATVQRNAEEIIYAADYTRRAFITGLPILPVLGARWTF